MATEDSCNERKEESIKKADIYLRYKVHNILY